MDTMLFPLAILAIVLLKVTRRYDVKLFGASADETAFRSAVTGRYWRVATLAVLAILVLVALSPESFPVFLAVDSIGFDLLVALFALQFRGVTAVAWPLARRPLARAGHCIWKYGLAPRRKLQLGTAAAAVSYVGAVVSAHLSGR